MLLAGRGDGGVLLLGEKAAWLGPVGGLRGTRGGQWEHGVCRTRKAPL